MVPGVFERGMKVEQDTMVVPDSFLTWFLQEHRKGDVFLRSCTFHSESIQSSAKATGSDMAQETHPSGVKQWTFKTSGKGLQGFKCRVCVWLM